MTLRHLFAVHMSATETIVAGSGLWLDNSR